MKSYLEHLQAEIEKAVATVDANHLHCAPEGKWSVTQIIEHLLMTYKVTNHGLERVLTQGSPLVTRPTLKQRVSWWTVLKIGYLPGGRKAPERVVPKGMSAEEAQQQFSAELQKMADHLNDCERRFGPQTKILDHIFLGPLTANEWRKFHWMHGRHHAYQITERGTK